MATIDSLTVSFLDLKTDEAYALIKDIRAARRAKPVEPKKFKKNAKGTRGAEALITAGKGKVSAEDAVKLLTPEQKLKLLRDMGVDV